MSNSYFRFKEFVVLQDRCAMKVTTDVGTGTGLLALMVAQMSGLSILGVEIDPEAAGQAAENFAGSPWADRLRVVCGDATNLVLRDHADSKCPERPDLASGPFDLIFCNPPFFGNGLRAPNAARNMARHGDKLSLDGLIEVFAYALSPEGVAAVIWPFDREEEFVAAAFSRGLCCNERVRLRQTFKHAPFRSMMRFSRVGLSGGGSTGPAISELVIRHGNEYSPEFVALLSQYYLNL